MTELPPFRWNTIQTKLREVLDTLDRRGEHLVAAHVAMALACIRTPGEIEEDERP